MDEADRIGDAVASLCAAAGPLYGPCTNATEWTAAALCGAAGHLSGQCTNSSECVFAGCANATDAFATVLSPATDGSHPLLFMMLVFALFVAACFVFHFVTWSCACVAQSAMLACLCACSPCLLAYARHKDPKLLDGVIRSDAPDHAFETAELAAAPDPPRSWLDKLAARAVEMHEARRTTSRRVDAASRDDDDLL